jgi:hypothetical protein
MTADDFKELYGEEYPAAIVEGGKRMPLYRETRFTRRYRAEDQKVENHISRFMDGSASITASELQQAWPSWDERLRIDFCQNCGWLHEQADFNEMLRFVAQHGSLSELSAVSLDVAARLPSAEAFEILIRGLRTAEIGQTCNITQAISLTKHPRSEETLRKHLNDIWQHPALWMTQTSLIGSRTMQRPASCISLSSRSRLRNSATKCASFRRTSARVIATRAGISCPSIIRG